MAGLNKVMLIEMYQSGMSLPEIAEKTSKAISTIRYHISKAGVLRSRSDGIRVAANRGRLGSGLRGKTRILTDAHKKNISKGRKKWGEKHARGFSIKKCGYYEVTVGRNKGWLVHDIIMEAILGRDLRSNEVVHHIDGDPTNNNPINLQVMDRAAHTSLHRKMEKQ